MVDHIRTRWAHVATMLLIVNLFSAAFVALAATETKKQQPVRIVAFGDSLTAGYALKPSAAFPVQLEKALKARGRSVVVENAGVSGDTTAGGLGRLAWAVPEGTDAVILELGGNDALRGIEPSETRANLEKIITELKARHIEVLLAGIVAPANWGDGYQEQFDAIFPDLAKTHDLVFYPFFLEGIALERVYTQSDGIHPSAKGIAEVVKRILPTVEELIARVEAKRANGSKT